MGSGCRSVRQEPVFQPGPADIPRELNKVSLPEYVIEPPDVLIIEARKAVPKPPYRMETNDVVFIDVAGLPESSPISGNFQVEPGGILNLGGTVGSIQVEGMTLEELRAAVTRQIELQYEEPELRTLSLVQTSAAQQITGEHLVSLDGTVMLGTYGQVYVAGMTRAEARQAIEDHLSAHLDKPQVSVDVFAYNSKVYYVIAQGTGAGDGVYSLPVTGNETVLDAIANVEGLQPWSSKRIWIARPSRAGAGCDQILPVDWLALTQGGRTETSYQIFPNDRVYIAEDRLSAVDAVLAKIVQPMERVFGVTLLGTGAVQRLRFFHRFGQGGGGGTGTGSGF